MKEIKRVLIMAGGTGGHVFPGLAFARFLREKGIEVHWMGTERGLEARLVPEAGIPLHLVDIWGIRRNGLVPLILAPFRLLRALLQSLRIIRQVKPEVVIGLGGFVSGPGGVAAWLSSRCLIIHEQNAKAGFTNQCLKHLAKRVLTGFPEVFPPQVKAIVTGNPVREELVSLPPPTQRLKNRQGKMRLLIFGGSLGAQVINELLPQVLAKFPAAERPEVYHQTGLKLIEETQAAYQAAGVEVKLEPFITDMQTAYAWADLVLCRAGALTVAELSAVGLGSIIIPYPYAVDDHQTINAQYLVKNGAAILIQQRDLTAESLGRVLEELNAAPEQRLNMAVAAYELRKIEVADKIFEACLAQ